jgi:hypothetical protein
MSDFNIGVDFSWTSDTSTGPRVQIAHDNDRYRQRNHREPDWSFVRSDPVAPIYDRCCRWIIETFDRVGTSTSMSAKLHQAFLRAGLPAPTMRMQAVIGDAISAAEWLRAVAELTIALTPTMEQQGVATLADISRDTLVDRVIQDVATEHSIVIGRAEIGAWVRIR